LCHFGSLWATEVLQVLIDMGSGVSSAVFDLNVESRYALFYGVGRAASLHCGGGCVLPDWAPFFGEWPYRRSVVGYSTLRTNKLGL
jgi:hypothetical protein